MRYLARVLVVCVAWLGLSGCAALQSEFDYTGGASDTVQVVMPEPLRVKSVNGKEVRLPLLIEYPYTVEVAAGASMLGFQYGEAWGVGDENELVRGPIMEVAFDAQAGQSYAVEFERPESLRYREHAEAYVASFSAWLSDAQGARIEAVSTGDWGGLGGKLASAVKTPEKAEEPVAVVEPAAKEEPAPAGNSRLESLQQLWQSANDEEKKAFMQWVVAPGS